MHYQTNANSNTKNRSNCVSYAYITQRTKDIERKGKTVKASMAKEGFMQEMEPELGIDK